MNPILENLMGTATLTDEIIASDLLISAKSGVRNYALALTETASPQVRKILRAQLEEAIQLHERVTSYMMERGWYHAYDIPEQVQLDLKNVETALNLP